jgi:pyruvate ferredoxin oxidoreductase beta subunit
MPDAKEVLSRLKLTEAEPFAGHKACAGCGGTVAVRLALKALGPRVFVGVPAGCMSAVGFLYPQMAFGVNAMISTFAGTASLLSGMASAVKALGIQDAHVVGFAGDGGTADIGIQALSGAIDWGDRILYICYDNEAYMNTGVQKSGLTPLGAGTTTSPAGRESFGASVAKKNLFEIIAAHGLPYAATASVGYPHDYLAKVRKAAKVDGPTFIQVLSPCPTGWGTPPETMGQTARQAVDCGLWPLREFENGVHRVNRKPRSGASVTNYLKAQGRFRHLGAEEIRRIEDESARQWKRIERLVSLDAPETEETQPKMTEQGEKP